MRSTIEPLPSELHLSRGQCEQAIAARRARLDEIFTKAGPDYLNASAAEVEEARQLNNDVDKLTAEMPNKHPGHPVSQGSWVNEGPLLSSSEPIAPYFGSDARRNGRGGVRLGTLIAGLAWGGKVTSYMDDVRLEALSALGTLTGPGGAYLIPPAVVGPFIDSVRPLTRVIEAGAQMMPMPGQIVQLPGWATPLKSSWRAESGAFTQVSPAIREVNLLAKSVGCYVTLSNELIADAASNLGAVEVLVENEVAKAQAQAIDLAALVGSGVDGQPLGIQNTPGVVTDSTLGINGATPADYDWLLEAVGLVAQNNFEPNAVLYSARTVKGLSKLKTGLASDKTQLRIPEPLASMRRLQTNQIPDNLVKGTSGAVCSLAFSGDWSQLVIGVRADMTVLVDPYSSATTGEVNLVVSSRVDIALLNTTAFIVSDGIKP